MKEQGYVGSPKMCRLPTISLCSSLAKELQLHGKKATKANITRKNTGKERGRIHEPTYDPISGYWKFINIIVYIVYSIYFQNSSILLLE